MSTKTQETSTVNTVMTAEELLKHWQGHRTLTRNVIEAFPEKEFFEFSIGGMRTFADMTMELLGIAAPGLREILSTESEKLVEKFDHKNNKANILARWDEATAELDQLWPNFTMERFQQEATLFGQYHGTGIGHVLYFIDNEIHHRGQGYVYLRALDITPPFFWER